MPKPDPATVAASSVYMVAITADECAERIRQAYAPLLEVADAVVKELEAHWCGRCQNRIGWDEDFSKEGTEYGRSDWKTCSMCKDARAALAAYRQLRPEEDGDE